MLALVPFDLESATLRLLCFLQLKRQSYLVVNMSMLFIIGNYWCNSMESINFLFLYLFFDPAQCQHLTVILLTLDLDSNANGVILSMPRLDC